MLLYLGFTRLIEPQHTLSVANLIMGSGTGSGGYPQIGVYFANCPSGGHDLLCLDYRGLSSGEEPSVVHVDQEDSYRITPVAPDFESFIRGLTNEECFELD